MDYSINKDIEYVCELLNLSYSSLAADLKIERSTISRWMSDKTVISKKNMETFYQYAYNKDIKINQLKVQMYTDSLKPNQKLLFHGAKKEIIGNIDLEYGKGNNDFGKGFYLGENYFQSASFISNFDDSCVYIFNYEQTSNLKVVRFIIDKEWMLAIAYFRGRINDYGNNKEIKKIISKVTNADIIIAPIADNQMYKIIDDFIFGNLTDEQTMHALSATKLGNQFVFKTKEALNTIKAIDRLYLCDNEKKDLLKEKEEENNIGLQKVKLAKREFAGKGKYIEDLLND